MQWQTGVGVLSLLVLMSTDPSAHAQSFSGTSANQQDQTQDVAEAGRFGRRDLDDDEEPDTWRRPGYRERQDGRYDRRPDMMERRQPGPTYDESRVWHQDRRRGPSHGTLPGPMGRPAMMAMMMILMDSDADGAVSLQEFQAGHERIFKAMDADKDGKLTLDEIRNFRLEAAGAPRR